MGFNRRTLLVLLATTFVIVSLLLIYINTRNYSLKVNFSDQSGKQVVKVYKPNDTKPVKVLSGPEYKANLPQDEYTIVVDESDKYKEFSKTFKLEGDLAIDVNQTLKRKYFDDILKPQEAAIKDVIRKNIVIPGGYEINDGSLLKDLGWYGTTISVKNPSQLTINPSQADTYRVILRKDSDEWKLVTIPPEINISNIKYPNIPKDVIKLANLVPVEINDEEQVRWQEQW